MKVFERYFIHSKNTPLPERKVPRILVERKETCINCGICVSACVYGVHERTSPAVDFTKVAEPRHEFCVACQRCINECPMEALELHPHPDFASLGDKLYAPDDVETILYEAETGRVPVSGQGYRGPFSGPGFDGIWTDMSEIVRPTRDGIHGREYISTDVELGRKLDRLDFSEGGELKSSPPPTFKIPLPMFLEVPAFLKDPHAVHFILQAAQQTGTFAILSPEQLGSAPLHSWIVLRLKNPPGTLDPLEKARMVELEDSPEVQEHVRSLKRAYPRLIVSVRIALDAKAAERARTLAEEGAEVIHLASDLEGKDLVENLGAAEEALVRSGLRDCVSVLLSGGIAKAEHVPKSILCGADAVGLDIPPLIALGLMHFDTRTARFSLEEILPLPEKTAVQRLKNLLNSWKDQLLEVMGAMGIREVRRMQGESGRAMFHKDLEKEFRELFNGSGSGPAPSPQSQISNPQPPVPGSEGFIPEDVHVFPVPSEIWRKVPKYRVKYTKDCIECGLCVSACPYGVHQKTPGTLKMKTPDSFNCIGSVCEQVHPVPAPERASPSGRPSSAARPGVIQAQAWNGEGWQSPFGGFWPSGGVISHGYCVKQCPTDAIRIEKNDNWNALGDKRWTADLLFSTWTQAETGKVPKLPHLEHKVGDSGGGFDLLGFRFKNSNGKAPSEEELKKIDTSLDLNKRNFGPRISIPIPWYGGGMSYGSIGLSIMLSRVRAAKAWGTFTSTGEGGYPHELLPYKDSIITQVATGMFGVREDTMASSRFVEIKYAQGAKPGLGGHLLSDKNTRTVAELRETVPGISLFSPFPFHSVYSVEDHKKHVDWMHATADAIRTRTKSLKDRADCDLLVSAKVSTPADVDMVAVGCYYGGVNVIHLDGSYGGTGAAPDIAKKNIAMPIEYAVPKVHRFLQAEGIRDEVVLIASGGIRTAHDIAKAIALGADGVVLGTSDLVAVNCTRCGNCESGRGCQHGIATTDPVLSHLIAADWGAQRIVNLYYSFRMELAEILWRLDLKSVRELRGRYDLLEYGVRS